MKGKMLKTVTDKRAKKKKPAPAPAPAPVTENGLPPSVSLRARITGEVTIKLRLLDPSYTPKQLAKLLNAGNASWDVGDAARYHRIEKAGRVIAEIEYADEDIYWEQYEPE